jgi:hypothetical protein
MARAVALLLVTAVLTGCKSSGPAAGPVDPFFGRTRVEPPRTGAVGGQPLDPSYPRTALPNPLRSSPSAVRPSSVPSNAVPPSQPSPSMGWSVPSSPSGTSVGGTTAVPPSPHQLSHSSDARRGSAPQPVQPAPGSGSGDRILIPAAANDLRNSVLAGGAIASAAGSAPLDRTSPTPSATPTAGPGLSSRPSSSPVSGLLSQRGVTGPMSDMTRPTINAVADRERITRPLGPRPAASTAGGLLPRPVDPAPTTPSPATGGPSTALPNRVIDITELPVGGVSGR